MTLHEFMVLLFIVLPWVGTLALAIETYRWVRKYERCRDKLHDIAGRLRMAVDNVQDATLASVYISALKEFIQKQSLWVDFLVFLHERDPRKVLAAPKAEDKKSEEAAAWEALPKEFLDKFHTQWEVAEARIMNAARDACKRIGAVIPANEKIKTLDLTATEVPSTEVRPAAEETPPPPTEAKPSGVAA